MLELLREPLGECVGPMKSKNRAAAGVWFKGVGEPSLDGCAFISERQRLPGSRHAVRHSFAVFLILQLDLSKGFAFLLGLDDSDCHLIDKEQIVGLAVA